jgi:hypothetical protein
MPLHLRLVALHRVSLRRSGVRTPAQRNAGAGRGFLNNSDMSVRPVAGRQRPRHVLLGSISKLCRRMRANRAVVSDGDRPRRRH